MEIKITEINTIYEVINARMVSMIRYGETRHGLNTGDVLKINTGDVNLYYKISYLTLIQTSSIPVLKIESHKINKTTHFITPCLGGTLEAFKASNYLINSYLGENNTLNLLYRYMGTTVFEALEKKLKAHPLYIKHEDTSYDTMLFSFNIEHASNDVNMFVQGKYSKFSELLKKQILKFWMLSDDGETADVLYKKDNRKKQLELSFNVKIPRELDLLSIPDVETECLNYDRDINLKGLNMIEVNA